MPDFNIRSDSVNVEEIMQQIRARIREKRGVDYTEQEIRELAAVKLEKFLDPSKVRSDLLEQYRQLQRDQANPNIELDEETLFGSPRPWLRKVRRLLRPILKLFVNPVPLMRAARLDTVRHAELFYELMHNLVVETTRLGIEVKNLKMRVESLSSRLDFDERRARALEGTVQYRPGAMAAPPAGAEAAPTAREEGEGAEGGESVATRSRRRRRRRGRRGGQRPGVEETAAGAGGEGQQAEQSGVRGPESGVRSPESRDRGPESGMDAGHSPSTGSGRGELAEPRTSDAGRRTPDAGSETPDREPGSEEPGT